MSNHMNLERRQNNLDKKIQEFEMDIDKKEKEKKGKCRCAVVCVYNDIW